MNDITPNETQRFDRMAAILLFVLTLFHLWYAATHQLVQDEAYYWQWSRHLDWGYYDNTPLVAPVIRIFTTLFGATQLGVRAGCVFCVLAAFLFTYLLSRRLFGARFAFIALCVGNLIPLYAGGAILMTQDPVQVAFWAATLYVTYLALTNNRGYWYLAGALVGLAAQGKLNALLLLPSIFLFLLLSPTARERWLRRPEPYLAGVIALAIFSPFVWWNHTHQNAFWIHIHSMGTRGSGHDGPKWVLRFLGDQALLVSPLFFLTYLYALVRLGKDAIQQRDDKTLYVWCPSVVVFAATLYVSLHSKVEGNWAVTAYLSGSILIALVLARAWGGGRKAARAWTGLGIALALILSIAPFYPNLLYAAGLKFHNPEQDRTNELYGWRELGARLGQEEDAMGGDAFVFGINYRMPSEAAFYMPGQPQTYSLFLHDRASEYMFWEDPKALVGRNAIFINDSKTLNDSDQYNRLDDLRAVFRRVEVQAPLRIYRNPPYGLTPIRTIQVVRCYGFKGYDVRQWQVGW